MLRSELPAPLAHQAGRQDSWRPWEGPGGLSPVRGTDRSLRPSEVNTHYAPAPGSDRDPPKPKLSPSVTSTLFRRALPSGCAGGQQGSSPHRSKVAQPRWLLARPRVLFQEIQAPSVSVTLGAHWMGTPQEGTPGKTEGAGY